MSAFKTTLLFVSAVNNSVEGFGGHQVLIENEALTLCRELWLWPVKHHPELQAARLRILQMEGAQEV
jgi:hypothetical protein